jgi:hypothetical protein
MSRYYWVVDSFEAASLYKLQSYARVIFNYVEYLAVYCCKWFVSYSFKLCITYIIFKCIYIIYD